MKSVLVKLGALALAAAAVQAKPMPNAHEESNIEARASNSWMGTNLYFIQGLADSEQDKYLDQLASYGAKTLRVWVNAQPGNNECVKGSKSAVYAPHLEETLGVFNDETLDILDKVLVKMVDRGIKAIISPHDANSLLGDYRADVYYSTFGSGYFYETQEAFDAYDNRLSHILNYQGAHSGRVWKEWSEAIFAFNLQNEPMTPKVEECTNNDVYGWACGRAAHMREVLGAENPIKISSGGIGGDISWGCTFMEAAVTCPQLDMIAIHRYAGYPGNWYDAIPGYISDSNGKLAYLEEWGVDTSNVDPATGFPSETSEMNSRGFPSMYWQWLPEEVSGCDYYDPSTDEGDKFGIFVNSGTDIGSAVQEANNSPAAQDWTGMLY